MLSVIDLPPLSPGLNTIKAVWDHLNIEETNSNQYPKDW